MKTYSEKLKSPKWQRKRLEILQRDKFTCQCCGDTESQLHVHHKEYFYGHEIWDYENDILITLCENCHKNITETKKYIKRIIDSQFVFDDVLGELKEIIDLVKYFNPYDLMMIKKDIEKYSKKKIKTLKKNG